MTPGEQRAGRVVASHQIARAAFLAALAFALVAVGWSLYVLIAGGSWWGPLHSFLAGTVLLAIAGASQMFTITWSSTVPPRGSIVLVQRWLLVIGVVMVLVGVTFDLPALVWVGGPATIAGLLVLGWVIYTAVRKSLLRRFDLSARFYLVAFSAGVVGITLGTLMGTEAIGSLFTTGRLIHVHLNLVGLVGLTIIGTIPTLLPTTAYNRAVSGKEALWAWWLAVGGAVLMAAGLWESRLVGVGTLAIAVSGSLLLVGILVRLWHKGRLKITFLQITVGTTWLIGWAIGDGLTVAAGEPMTHFSGWTGAVVLAGVGQVLAGSLAYLVPVLRGSPFERNRAAMEARPWLSMTVLNAAGLCLGFGLSVAAAVLAGVWLADFFARLGQVLRPRPEE